MIKIIAGKYKGRNIITPATDTTRPTKSMSRGGIFSSIGYKIVNSVVLDLFAGSGAYAIESLSRGAKFAYLSDNNVKSMDAVLGNMSKINETNYLFQKVDYKEMLDYLNKTKTKIDITFLDPPYALDCYNEIIEFMLKNDIITKDGVIVIESNHDVLVNEKNSFDIKELKYGYSKVKILRRKL